MTISEEKKEKIIDLWSKKLQLNEISILTEISEPTCRKIINEYKENPDSELEEPLFKKNKSQITALNGVWMAQLFGVEWNDDIDLIQLFFDLNRLANETEKDLYEFLKTIKFIINQYYRYSDSPHKLFDIFLDISSNIKFFEDGYDMNEVAKVFEKIYDQHIFIKDLEEKYNSIAEFKTTKEEEIEEIKEFQEQQFGKAQKIMNQLKEMNQHLSDIIIKAKNIIMSQKQYYKQKLGSKIGNIHVRKLKEILSENIAMTQVFKELETRYPNEVNAYIVEEIKNGKL